MIYLFNFFSSLVSLIDIIVTFVVSFFQGIIEMISLLLSSIVVLPSVFSVIPSPITVFLTTGVAITLIRFVIRKGDD